MIRAQKGFTLIEITVVLIIIGVFAALAFPNFVNSIEQTKAQTAQNNLLAISAAEQKYYEDHGSYCGTAPCGVVGMTGNDPFTYTCSAVAGSPPTFHCTASDGTVSLSTTGTTVSCTGGGSACPPCNGSGCSP